MFMVCHVTRLEQLMADMPHLKIVEVIVKCCCPSITNSSLPGACVHIISFFPCMLSLSVLD